MSAYEGLEKIFASGRGAGRGLLPLESCLREPKQLRPPKTLPSRNPKTSTFDPRLSAEASEFVPKPEVFLDVDELGSTDWEEESTDFQDAGPSYQNSIFFILEALKNRPGQFFSLANKLVVSINSAGIDDAEGYSFIADSVINMSILEPNFRYSGARLCNVLAHKLKATSGNTSFRYILLQKCKAQFDLRDKLIAADPSRLRALTLFLGELYLHLQAGEGQAAKRIQILQKPLFQIMDVFLTVPEHLNIRCINQVLKLCGAALEDDNRAANGGKALDMDQIISKIKTSALAASLPVVTKQFLMEVVELRASNWGRSGLVAQENEIFGAAAAIEAEGMKSFLNSDEAAFLAAADLDAVSDPEEDTESDDEMYAYYEKFLAGLN